MDTNETPTEPMTEERFGLECIRTSLELAPKGSTLQLQSERMPKTDTKDALVFRCIVSMNGKTHETPFTTGTRNVDAWVKANLDACAQKTRAQTAKGADIRDRHGLGFWGVSSKDAALLFDPACPSYRKSLDGAPKLAALREAYRPELGTVLWCLFRDADGIEDHEDWISWAEARDFFSTRGLDTSMVRKVQHDFEACRRGYFFLRSVFGSHFDRLMELSREV